VAITRRVSAVFERKRKRKQVDCKFLNFFRRERRHRVFVIQWRFHLEALDLYSCTRARTAKSEVGKYSSFMERLARVSTEIPVEAT